MTEWYYQVTGEVIGPVSLEELKKEAGAGRIGSGTLVREGTDGQWVAASQVPGLVDSSAEPVEGSPQKQDMAPEVSTEMNPEQVAEESKEQDPGIRRSPLALRPCSDCGMMVSMQASICPQCGRAFHESSFTARYKGEQPVVVFTVIGLLAIGFLFLSPLLVYKLALTVAPRVIHSVESQVMAPVEFASVVTGFYVFSMLVCTFLGGAVGRPRMAYLTGCTLGLFFGPLGIFVAFAIDKRPQCPQCASRLSGLAKECPCCHARLVWKVEPAWY